MFDENKQEFNEPVPSPMVDGTQSKQLNCQEVVSQQKTIENWHNLFQMDKTKGVEHEKEEAKVMATSMHHVNGTTDSKRLSLTQQHPFHEGVKVFGHEKGKEAALKELRQQHA